jgi:glycosyltransferase involved in cell wall biosynthesis
MTEDNWGKAPMGGAEISAVNLGEELLKAGYDVTYFLQRAVPFGKRLHGSKLHVRRHDQIYDEKLEYFICVRPHPVISQPFDGKVKKILWSGDAFDQSSNEIFWRKEVAQSMSAFVFKSNWQKEKILEKYFYIEPEKAHVIYNGIKADHFEGLHNIRPQANRFIHASTWYRGVANFARIWPQILEHIPDAEIHVFSKTSLYSENNPGDLNGWPQIAEKLSRLPGMVLREPVPQYILSQEFRKAWLMLYPNSGFVESSCGAALQSQAAGTPVITTARAGLPETVGSGGILIDEREGWENEFAIKTIELCKNKQLRQSLSDSGRQRVSQETWQKKATEWGDFLKSL